MLDVKAVQEAALKEVNEEKMTAAKNKVKAKMRELSSAKKVVANIERELEDIYADLGQE